MKDMRTGHLKAIIFVVAATAFVTTFTGSALNLSIPDISIQFGADAETAGWIITGYTLSVAAFSVPFGRMADITCRKTVLVTGIAIFAACCIAAVFSVTVIMLIAVRIIQGIGAAMIFSTNTAVIAEAFPDEQRGRALGYSLAATYAGMSAGPVVGGFLNYNFGWQSVFVLTGLIALLALFAAIFRMPGEKRERGKISADITGSVLYMLFLIMVMYGIAEAGQGIWPYVIIAAGIIIGAVFICYELRVENPVIKIRIFTENIGYACSNAAAMMNYGATFAVGYLASIYLQVIMGYSSQTAGLIMICQPAVITLLTPIAGRLSDKHSPYLLACGGMIVCAAGTGMFLFLCDKPGLPVITGVLVITGIGVSLFSSPNTNAVMSYVKEEDFGEASSLLATMRSMGNTLSMAIVTIAVKRYVGGVALNAAEPDAFMKVVSVSFIVFTVICTAGAFVSLRHGAER